MPRKSSAAIAFSDNTATRIRPPDDLVGDERKLFIDLVVSTRADHFQDSDIAMLCVYCKALVLERTASAGLKADGYVVDGKPSGWLPILQAASRTISTFSRMLRLNPSARQSTPASEPLTISYYERMNLERRDDESH